HISVPRSLSNRRQFRFINDFIRNPGGRKPKVDLDRLLSPVESFDRQRSSSGLAVLVPLFVFESSCSSVILCFLRFEWSFGLGALGCLRIDAVKCVTLGILQVWIT
ncbi:unnamed protein product, partial [Musa acuminata subsp. burmannicoides]